MQNPKIHSPEIDPFIPEGHWLMQHWLEHPDPTEDDSVEGGEIVCERCGRVIYTFSEGTQMYWVETGRISDRHGHPEPQTTCLPCFAARDFSDPDTNLRYALTDEGGPQPYDGN